MGRRALKVPNLIIFLCREKKITKNSAQKGPHGQEPPSCPPRCCFVVPGCGAAWFQVWETSVGCFFPRERGCTHSQSYPGLLTWGCHRLERFVGFLGRVPHVGAPFGTQNKTKPEVTGVSTSTWQNAQGKGSPFLGKAASGPLQWDLLSPLSTGAPFSLGREGPELPHHPGFLWLCSAGDSFSFRKNAQWCMCTQRLSWKQVHRPLQHRPYQL